MTIRPAGIRKRMQSWRPVPCMYACIDTYVCVLQYTNPIFWICHNICIYIICLDMFMERDVWRWRSSCTMLPCLQGFSASGVSLIGGAHEASTLQPCKACAFLIRHPYKVSRPLFYLLFYKYMHQHPGPYITCLCHKPLYSLQPWTLRP